jgi:cytochrome P450
MMKPRTRPAGPGLLQTLSIMGAFRGGNIDALDALHERYGALCYLPAPMGAFVIFAPELMAQVLQHEHRNYTKSHNYAQLKYVLGEGLVTSEGAAWVSQRRQLAKLFQSSSIAGYAEHVEPVIAAWAEEVFAEQPRVAFDVSDALARLAVGLSCSLLFGETAVHETHMLRVSLDVASQAAVERIYAVLRLPRWIPLLVHKQEREARNALDGFVERQVRMVPEGRLCGLTMLRSIEPKLTKKEMRDQLITLLVAGQDTMLAALSWLINCLASRPELQEAIRIEAQKAASSTPSARLDRAPLARSCVLEALRLWPPIPMIARSPNADLQLGDVVIPKGSVVLCAIRAMQRSSTLWSSPLSFDPTRFRNESEHQGFAAFGLGPRRCIGEKLALYELVSVLSALLLRGKITSTLTRDPIAHTTIAMKPKHGIAVVFTRHPPARVLQ